MEPFRGGLLVSDGHHNRVLWVSTSGEVSILASFDNIVPTGLEVHGNTVLMAEADPIPQVPADGSLSEIAGGLNLPTSLEFIGNSAYIVNLLGEIRVIEDVPAPPFGRGRKH